MERSLLLTIPNPRSQNHQMATRDIHPHNVTRVTISNYAFQGMSIMAMNQAFTFRVIS